MSIWSEYGVEAAIVGVLTDVPVGAPHAFGRPYMSAYQLAIELHRRHPEVAEALGVPIGGAGIGERNSLAQYLARELSRRIGANPTYQVEGAFMTNVDVERLVYSAPDGSEIVSSLTDSGFDLSLFRLRVAAS